jgi:tetratricopeptide (TPR) repeat protein
LARRLDDQRRLGWVSVYLCRHHMMTGSSVAEVRRFVEIVELIGETLDDVPLQVAGHYYRTYVCHISGDYHGAERVCLRLEELLRGDRSRERFRLAAFPAMWCRAYLARVLAERGVFEEGDAHGRDGLRIAEAVDHPFSVSFAWLALAHLRSVRGDLGRAVDLLERALAVSRELNFTILMPVVMASLGHACAWSGRVEEGVSWLQQATAAYETAGGGWLQVMSVVQLGEAYLVAERLEDARPTADRAITLARQQGERGHEAWALRLLAEIAAHPRGPDVTAAEAHYGAALALASELDMRPLAAHCHLGLGKLYRYTDDGEKVHKHLTTASTMYREMGMSFWLEQAEAALGPPQ